MRKTKSHSYCNRCEYNGKGDEHCIYCAIDHPDAPNTVNLDHATVSVDSVIDSGHDFASDQVLYPRIDPELYEERYDKIKLYLLFLKSFRAEEWPKVVDWTLGGGENPLELASVLGCSEMTIRNRMKAGRKNIELAKVDKAG